MRPDKQHRNPAGSLMSPLEAELDRPLYLLSPDTYVTGYLAPDYTYGNTGDRVLEDGHDRLVFERQDAKQKYVIGYLDALPTYDAAYRPDIPQRVTTHQIPIALLTSELLNAALGNIHIDPSDLDFHVSGERSAIRWHNHLIGFLRADVQNGATAYRVDPFFDADFDEKAPVDFTTEPNANALAMYWTDRIETMRHTLAESQAPVVDMNHRYKRETNHIKQRNADVADKYARCLVRFALIHERMTNTHTLPNALTKHVPGFDR